jgi:hypothetical protein
LEHRVGLDRLVLAKLADAEPFGQEHLVVIDNRDGQTGHSRFFQQLCRVLADALDRLSRSFGRHFALDG